MVTIAWKYFQTDKDKYRVCWLLYHHLQYEKQKLINYTEKNK